MEREGEGGEEEGGRWPKDDTCKHNLIKSLGRPRKGGDGK